MLLHPQVSAALVLAGAAPSTQGSPWWVTVAVGLISALAALGGVTLTARWAAGRQREELRHERDLADLKEVREVLDQAARDMIRAEHGMLATHRLWEEQGAVGDPHRGPVHKASDLMRSQALRIAIRLGDDDPVTRAYRDAADALSEASERLEAHSVGASTPDETVTGELEQRFADARAAFFAVAHESVGSRHGREGPGTPATGG